jgi:hypothetical protein
VCTVSGTAITGTGSTFASPQPGQVSVDANYMFWGTYQSAGPTAATLWRATKTGGSPTAISTAGTATYISATATDGTNVFFGASDGIIRTVPAIGGSTGTISTVGIGIQYFAVDASYLYFTQSVSGSGGIYRIAKTTGSTATAIDNTAGAVCREGIALDAGYVYWAEDGCGVCGSTPGRILRAALGTTTVEVIATGQAHPNYVAVDAYNVYWSNSCDGTIKRAPKAGGAAVTVATGQSSPAGVAVNGGYVYWANSSSGKIMRALACQGTPAEVYGSGTNPVTLVTDGTNLFWNDASASKVGLTQ